jgi:hypothetical protein
LVFDSVAIKFESSGGVPSEVHDSASIASSNSRNGNDGDSASLNFFVNIGDTPRLSTVLVLELVSNLDSKYISINEVEGLSLVFEGRHRDGTRECCSSALDNLFGDAVLGGSLDSVSADIYWRLSPGDNDVTVTLSNNNSRSLHKDSGSLLLRARNNKLDRGRPLSTIRASRDSADSHSDTKVSTLLLGSSDGVLVQRAGEISSVEVVVLELSTANTVLSLVRGRS